MLIATRELEFSDDMPDLAPGLDIKVGFLELDPEDEDGLSTRPCTLWRNTYPHGARVIMRLHELRPSFRGVKGICL